ncbi:MAG: ATP synthase F1 subunit delta [Nitrospirota bacterium]
MGKSNLAAKVYADAILQIAIVENSYDRIVEELLHLKDILQKKQEFYDFLHNPNIPSAGKKDALVEIFGRDFSSLLLNFIILMIDKQKQGILLEMIGEFFELSRDIHQKIFVEVTTSIPISLNTEKKLKGELSKIAGRQIYMRNVVDKSIMGGAVVRIGEKIIDGSVKSRLQQIREKVIKEISL